MLPESVTFFGNCSFPQDAVVTQQTHYSPEEVLTREFVNNNFQKVFTISQGIKRIDINCFKLTNIEEVRIPKSVEEIGCNAFAFCENMEKVTFEDGI